MTGGAAVLALLALALAGPVPRALAAADWPRRAPVPGLVLWQAVGLAGGVSAVGAGLLVGVAPLADDVPRGLAALAAQALAGRPLQGLTPLAVAGLVWAAGLAVPLLTVLAVSAGRTLRARKRHRELVDLVAARWPQHARARVLDASAPVAYCLPGLRSRVVISAGTLTLLDGAELAAVLAHERAHTTERHDLVVLPFVALRSLMPWLPGVRRSEESVATLVEMLADDRARRRHDPRALASALVRVATAGVPCGALAAADRAVVARVRRLLDPPAPASRRVRAAAFATAAALLALPALLLTGPLLV